MFILLVTFFVWFNLYYSIFIFLSRVFVIYNHFILIARIVFICLF